ncbi:transcriptional regulator ATRX homolog [Zophobas morio]|uniref:transcriptional regulator ATRX homolog n=1 Tax=Zophobas morio TaxID=2755281 RepID=UPI0030838997
MTDVSIVKFNLASNLPSISYFNEGKLISLFQDGMSLHFWAYRGLVRFNTDATAKLFILTHRVGGLGLNLVGANGVIMIGSNYNPSLDTQSMYRVYRFGQTKKCYVYSLLFQATMEEKIYQRCVVKLHLSGTVVDKLHFVRRYTSSDLRELYKVDFSEYTVDRPIPIVPTDKLLAQLVQNTYDIYRYHLHNSLLENRPEEELTDEDKKMAWDEFNNMEEAAKPLPQFAPPVVVNPIFQLPIFPAHMSPAHRGLRVYLHPRTNGPTLVPNPMNNNARGFLPRVFLPNGRKRAPRNSYQLLKLLNEMADDVEVKREDGDDLVKMLEDKLG